MNIGGLELIWGLTGLVLMAVFWVVVLMIVVKLVNGRSSASVTRRSSALEILEERYARGEISQKEFVERRDVLSGRVPAEPTPPL